MSPRKSKISRAAHIKSSTIGTSNEVSFSVLDAAKLSMDERHGEARRIKQLGKIDLYSGETEPDYTVASFSDAAPDVGPQTKRVLPREHAMPTQESFDYEVARKKAVRKFRNGTKIAIACAIVVAIVAGVGVGVSTFISQKDAFTSSLSDVLTTVKKTDDELVLVNEVLADPSSDSAKKQLSSALDGLDQAELSLSEAKQAADLLPEKAVTTENREAALQASRTIEGRLAMVDSAREILTDVSLAQQALSALSDLSTKVAQSESYASEAAQKVSQPTDENLAAALTLLQQSISCLSEAAEGVRQAQEYFPKADLADISSYLSTQVAALESEVAAVSALKEGDTEKARTSQDAYEAKSAQAQKYATALANANNLVVSAYQTQVNDLIGEYESARDEVALADEYLRQY